MLAVSKMCVALCSGWFRTTLFRPLRSSLTYCGEPQTVTFAVILPCTPLYGVYHCLIVGSEHIARSNITSSDKTLTLFSVKLAFRIFLNVWISMIIKTKKKERKKKKIAEKKSKSTEMSLQQTADNVRPISITFLTSIAMHCW